MIVGTATKRPVISALAFLDRKIIDTGDPQAHQAAFVEFPILVAITAEPVPAVIVPFIGEANRDAVFPESPDFLDQPVIEFTLPFPGQECLDLCSAL